MRIAGSKNFAPKNHAVLNCGWQLYNGTMVVRRLLLLLLLLPSRFSRWTWINQFPVRSSCSICSRKESLWLMEWGFLWAGCPSCYPTISIKALKGTKALAVNSGLASSFLHPPPDSWQNGRCFLHVEGSVHKGSISRNSNFSGNEFLCFASFTS